MRRVEIFIPYLGETLNTLIFHEKGNWIYKGGKSKAATACAVARVDAIDPFIKPVVLSFWPHVSPRRRKLDVTNYAATTKMIEDCLVDAGVLRNDTSEFVKGVYLGEPRKVDKIEIEGMVVCIHELDLDTIPEQHGLPLEIVEELPF